MATKHVCDFCGNDIQDHERYKVDVVIFKILDPKGKGNANREKQDSCGYCANKIREIINAKDFTR